DLKPFPFRPISPNRHEVPLRETRPLDPYFPLPADAAHYVGEGVALVIAESLTLAKDAAERVVVGYEPLPATVDTAAASDIRVDTTTGDIAAVDAAFRRAAHPVRLQP